jgi:RNA polymerase sigma-70 factor (ECF subfamily)
VQQLFDRCVTGDGQAWRELHRTYYPTACRFLTRMGLEGADLDDACQDVFVQVFRYLPRFQGRSDFQTWLYRLCLSQAARLQRTRKLQTALGRLWGRARQAASAATGQAWTEPMATLRVQQVLNRMKPLHREVFVLFMLEDLDGDQIAHILECPAATIRRRLHYARQEFETMLCEGGGRNGKGTSP